MDLHQRHHGSNHDFAGITATPGAARRQEQRDNLGTWHFPLADSTEVEHGLELKNFLVKTLLLILEFRLPRTHEINLMAQPAVRNHEARDARYAKRNQRSPCQSPGPGLKKEESGCGFLIRVSYTRLHSGNVVCQQPGKFQV